MVSLYQNENPAIQDLLIRRTQGIAKQLEYTGLKQVRLMMLGRPLMNAGYSSWTASAMPGFEPTS